MDGGGGVYVRGEERSKGGGRERTIERTGELPVGAGLKQLCGRWEKN